MQSNIYLNKNIRYYSIMTSSLINVSNFSANCQILFRICSIGPDRFQFQNKEISILDEKKLLSFEPNTELAVFHVHIKYFEVAKPVKEIHHQTLIPQEMNASETKLTTRNIQCFSYKRIIFFCC